MLICNRYPSPNRISAMRFSLLVLCLPFAILLAAISGCGGGNDNRAIVVGDITLDGKPLEQGAIKFTPLPGTSGAVTGTEIKDGHYQLKPETGAAIGPNRVEITAMRKSGKLVASPLGPPGSTVELEVSAVAPRFNTSSTLKLDVKPGENRADFAVESQ